MGVVLAQYTLIAGLGNPTGEYEKTRHNAGFWFVEEIARRESVSWSQESRFEAAVAKYLCGDRKILLLRPATYMNHSGRSIGAISRYYKIEFENIIVAHDELDFQPGVVRLKKGGGHGGHNGVRDVISCLGGGSFLRVRIGIGRPGSGGSVLNYVLGRPGSIDSRAILSALEETAALSDELIFGRIDKAMNSLHTMAKN